MIMYIHIKYYCKINKFVVILLIVFYTLIYYYIDINIAKEQK